MTSVSRSPFVSRCSFASRRDRAVRPPMPSDRSHCRSPVNATVSRHERARRANASATSCRTRPNSAEVATLLLDPATNPISANQTRPTPWDVEVVVGQAVALRHLPGECADACVELGRGDLQDLTTVPTERPDRMGNSNDPRQQERDRMGFGVRVRTYCLLIGELSEPRWTSPRNSER